GGTAQLHEFCQAEYPAVRAALGIEQERLVFFESTLVFRCQGCGARCQGLEAEEGYRSYPKRQSADLYDFANQFFFRIPEEGKAARTLEIGKEFDHDLAVRVAD